MTTEDYENFESSRKHWICDNTFVKDVKVRDHCHVQLWCKSDYERTWKFRF